MPWPTVTIPTTGMDSDSDALPRADIKQMAENVNAIKDMRAVANGIASLGADGKVPSAQLPAASVTFLPGMMMPYAGASAPSGWLLCAGQAVSRTTQAALFAVIGTTFGAGDGSTTFNVPDLRGRVAIGKDNMNASDAGRVTAAATMDGDTLGAAGGSETHTLTSAQMPVHAHTATQGTHTHTTSSNGDHTHTGGGAVGQAGDGGNPVSSLVAGNTGSAGAHTHTANAASAGTITVANSGSGAAHANLQPSLVLNYIIKS